MNLEKLYQKYKSNFTVDSVFAALSSPSRLLDIFQQTVEGMTDDSVRFHAELASLDESPDIFTVSPARERKTDNSCSPFAYLSRYRLHTGGFPIFDISLGNTESLLHTRRLAKQITSRVTLADFPDRGVSIAGPTSKDSVLNNGMAYLEPVSDEWITASGFGDNKAGGIYVNNQGRLGLANTDELEGVMREKSGFLVMPTSIYFDTDDLRDNKETLLESAIRIAATQGYLYTYNVRAGFLVYHKEQGSYSYLTSRHCTEYAASAFGLTNKKAEAVGVAMHLHTVLSFLAEAGEGCRAVMLEEGGLAKPRPYFSISDSVVVSSAAPVSFIFGIKEVPGIETSI